MAVMKTDNHLRLATAHVANAENRVKTQQSLIRDLENAGEPTEASGQILKLFEETLELMRGRVDQIRRQLIVELH
jgi:hypothetical protein